MDRPRGQHVAFGHPQAAGDYRQVSTGPQFCYQDLPYAAPQQFIDRQYLTAKNFVWTTRQSHPIGARIADGGRVRWGTQRVRGDPVTSYP